MNKITRHIVLAVIALMASLPLRAQVSVEAKIDSVAIFIGQQARLSVAVTSPKGARVVFPTLRPSQYMVPGVEILEVSKIDTADVDNGQQLISRVFTLTSFDEQLYPLPGMKVQVNGKTYQANPLALKVITMDVDTLHPEKFFPPKDVQNNPFSWREWRAVIGYMLLFLLLCGLAFYLVRRLRQNKPVLVRFKVIKKVPAHQRAMDEIQQLKTEHLQQSGDQKVYYTRLTDALRQYIRERFGFNAMEMTSSEIIEHLNASDDKKRIDELRELFMTADLVKFAKYATLINENDQNLVNAIRFIDETKSTEQASEERVATELTEDERKSRQQRKSLKAAIAITIGVAVVLLGYVIYSAYQLLM